jgi:predicted esterase
MIKQYIKIQRTARYFLSTEPSERLKRVIFVLHGYAQNADSFLESLMALSNDETLLVAPEGLSKFYWKDFTSNPSSSWMTSLERENEILDTMNYLALVSQEILTKLDRNSIDIYILGFSQGAATASRFVAFSSLPFKAVFLYGGSPAHDIEWIKLPKNLLFYLIYGNEDPLVSEQKALETENWIQTNGFEVHRFVFNGRHKIEDEAIAYIAKVTQLA